MPEELYNSHDYCLLVDEYEALKLENEELIADKKRLINAAMDGGDKFYYTAHDIAYRDLERKCKALEADYVISNRELLVKQVETYRLTAKYNDALACNQIQADKIDDLTAELAELRERYKCRYCNGSGVHKWKSDPSIVDSCAMCQGTGMRLPEPPEEE